MGKHVSTGRVDDATATPKSSSSSTAPTTTSSHPSSSTTAPSSPLSVVKGRAPRRRMLPPKLRDAEDNGEGQGKGRKRARVSVGVGGGAGVKGRAKKLERSPAGGPRIGYSNGIPYGGGVGSQQQQQQQQGHIRAWTMPATHVHTQTPTVNQKTRSSSPHASTHTPPCVTTTSPDRRSTSGSMSRGGGGGGNCGGGGGGPSGVSTGHTEGLPLTAIGNYTVGSMCVGAGVEGGRKTGGACAGVDAVVATTDSGAEGSVGQQHQEDAGIRKQHGEGDTTSSLQRQLQDALRDNTRLQTALTDARSRAHTITETLNKTHTQCDQLQQTLLNTQREKEGVEAALAEAQKKTVKVEDDDDGLSREGKKALLKSRRALTGVQKALCDTQDALKVAEDARKVSEGALRESEREAGRLKAVVEESQKGWSECVKDHALCQTRVRACEGQLEGCRREVGEVKGELKETQEALSAALRVCEGRGREKEELVKRVEEVEGQNAGLQAVLDAANKDAAQAKKDVADAHALTVQALQDELRAVRNANLSTEMSLTEANKKAQAALAKVTQVEDEKSVLEASVRELKQTESNLQAQLLQLRIRLSEVASEKRDGWARDLELMESFNKRLRDASSRETSLRKQLQDMRSVLRDTTSKTRTAPAPAVPAAV